MSELSAASSLSYPTLRIVISPSLLGAQPGQTNAREAGGGFTINDARSRSVMKKGARLVSHTRAGLYLFLRHLNSRPTSLAKCQCSLYLYEGKESNPHRLIRSRTFYPLNYRGLLPNYTIHSIKEPEGCDRRYKAEQIFKVFFFLLAESCIFGFLFKCSR